MYVMHEDPAHGWLAVPSAAIVAAGAQNNISTYSYISRDGSMVYLEEDCDIARWAMQAAPAGTPVDGLGAWIESQINGTVYHKGQAPIRSLPSYSPERLRGGAA